MWIIGEKEPLSKMEKPRFLRFVGFEGYGCSL